MKNFMKNFKEAFKNMFKGPTGKLMLYLVIFMGIVILIFIFIGIASLFKGSRYSYKEVETKMKNAAIEYYDERKDKLPIIEGGEVVVDVSSLVETKKLKALDKITEKGATCTGHVTVQKNGEYFLYTPYLDCGEKYKTISLVEKIKMDNPVVTEKDGLYQINDNLVFRGEKVNNYVSFAGKLWSIIRIDSDGSLRLLEDDIVYTGFWDDRYNIDRDNSTGINNFELSRLKDGLNKIYYKLDMFSDNSKEKIVFKNLCVGKRNINETDNSGNVECSTLTEPMPIGLMNVNEFMVASLDSKCLYATDAQCSNYNYLAKYSKSTWTLNADASNTYKAYKFSGSGFSSSITSNEVGLRLVIYLSDNINYTKGTGTLEDPYVVE